MKPARPKFHHHERDSAQSVDTATMEVPTPESIHHWSHLVTVFYQCSRRSSSTSEPRTYQYRFQSPSIAVGYRSAQWCLVGKNGRGWPGLASNIIKYHHELSYVFCIFLMKYLQLHHLPIINQCIVVVIIYIYVYIIVFQLVPPSSSTQWEQDISLNPQCNLSPSCSMAPSKQGCAFCSSVAKFSTSGCVGNLSRASKTACRTKGAAARAGLCSKRRPRARQRTSVDTQKWKMKLQPIGFRCRGTCKIHLAQRTLDYSLDIPVPVLGLCVLCNVAPQTKSIPATQVVFGRTRVFCDSRALYEQ